MFSIDSVKVFGIILSLRWNKGWVLNKKSLIFILETEYSKYNLQILFLLSPRGMI